MAASFPNAKKTFSQIVNGVTKLVAALFNVVYDESEAEQTFIGPTGGGAQSYSTSMTDMVINYRRGCRVDYKGAADLYVRAGEIMIVDASGNKRLRRNTADTTVTWADIDAGGEEASTTYYVYALADTNATTFTVKISKAASPSGATFYKLIGAFYNDGSSNIIGITNLNLMGGVVGTWDSGIITVAANSGYALVHNLGTMKISATIWFSSNSDMSAAVILTGVASTNYGTSLRGLTTTAVALRTHTTGVFYGLFGDDSTADALTSGYVQVFLEALA